MVLGPVISKDKVEELMKKLEQLGEGDVLSWQAAFHLLCRMTCMNRSWQGWMEKV